MRAIMETGREQIAVEAKGKFKIPRLEAEVGKEVKFDKVLLISGDDAPIIGKPISRAPASPPRFLAMADSIRSRCLNSKGVQNIAAKRATDRITPKFW